MTRSAFKTVAQRPPLPFLPLTSLIPGCDARSTEWKFVVRDIKSDAARRSRITMLDRYGSGRNYYYDRSSAKENYILFFFPFLVFQR